MRVAIALVLIAIAVAAAGAAAFAMLYYAPKPASPEGPASGGTSSAAVSSTPPVSLEPQLGSDFRAELVASDLSLPTSMAFVDGGSKLLVLEKETGQVMMVSSDGTKKQVLKLNVARGAEQGLLGIAVSGSGREVFLYMTEADAGGHVLGNRIYRYDWDGNSLSNPVMLLELPAIPGPVHNGGKLEMDSRSGQLYAVIGDVNRLGGPLTNEQSGEIDDTSVIVRVDSEGRPPADNPFAGYSKKPFTYYFAYGVRNSFGMDFDPVTGKLWDTENGPESYDEINVVNSGFNSGWKKVMGPIARSGHTESDLLQLQGSHYLDPVFSWKSAIGVTDIEFFKSDKFGPEYKNNIFVGDYNAGDLYFFKVNAARDGLDLAGSVGDLVADSYEESLEVRFGAFPGGIVDLETGPNDGYLYVLTFAGNLYRVVPAEATAASG